MDCYRSLPNLLPVATKDRRVYVKLETR